MGNTIAMPTDELTPVCAHARATFPFLSRITVYGSSQYIHKKGPSDLLRLKEAGLTRSHVGLESGDDTVLQRIKKGTNGAEQIKVGQWVRQAEIELSEYVMIGIGGKERTREHALHTAKALNAINPDYQTAVNDGRNTPSSIEVRLVVLKDADYRQAPQGLHQQHHQARP